VCPDQWQPGFSGPGSFAELVAIPRADFNLIALPESVSMDAAAALGCRFATAYRAVAQVGAVEPGETVAVFGCGGVGLSIIMIAVARGARVVAVDIAPGALAMAESLGAYAAIRSASGSDLAGALRELLPTGVDATFDALGSIDTCRTAVESLRPRGRHVQVGLLPPAEVGDRASVPMHRVIGLELSILGSHGMSARSYPEMLALMARGHLDPTRLITRRLTLDEAPSALETMATNPHPGVSVIHPFEATA
jgi:alcohol dehydrogenase